MRIDPATLDPTSRLAHRIAAALARDACEKAAKTGVSRRSTKSTSSSSFGHGASDIYRSDITGPASAGEPQITCEEDLQRAVVAMIAAEARPDVLAFHVPNGGRRGKAEAGRLKAMGTRAGVPDIIALADGRAYGLELKTARGRQSEAQKAMADLFARAGCPYEIARTVAEARAHLTRWGLVVARA